MATTSHLGITLLEQSQAQKEITINEALARIDAVLNSGAIDRDLATPPGSPAQGDVYIVAGSPTGDWSGKAGQVAYYDQVWRFIVPREGMLLWLNDENDHVLYNGGSWVLAGIGGGVATVAAMTIEGRLTLTSNTPVTTADVTAATTLYYTPYKGNRIALYDGTAWSVLSFSQVSLSIPATTATMYDVWGYNNSGALALEVTAWTNDTTRATALAWQDGVYVKSGATTRRYLGSIRTTSTSGQTEDSKAKRYVWNCYNRVMRALVRLESTNSWNYSTASFRQANNSASNQLDFVRGLDEDAVTAAVRCAFSTSAATVRTGAVAIGIDSTTSKAGACINAIGAVGGASISNIAADYSDSPGLGRHTLTWLEYGAGSDTQTFYGAGSYYAGGIVGAMLG